MKKRVRLSEEARFELSLSAMGRERWNRPVAMLVLAVALLLAAGLFALYAVGSRASARADLAKALEDQAHVEVKLVEWKQLSESEGAAPQSGKAGFKVSVMEDLATRAGMKTRPNAPRAQDDKSRPGVVMYRHFYTEVRDPSLANMVEWVRLACAEIAGLEIDSLAVRPEPAGWKMEVTFRRWERTGS